jgi:hypothetical protein
MLLTVFVNLAGSSGSVDATMVNPTIKSLKAVNLFAKDVPKLQILNLASYEVVVGYVTSIESQSFLVLDNVLKVVIALFFLRLLFLFFLSGRCFTFFVVLCFRVSWTWP